MPREFPDFVDPWKAADGKRVFQGTVPLKWMRRLAPLLAPAGPGDSGDAGKAGADGAEATFTARFAHDEQGVVTISLDVEADLPLVCQRSMLPYLEHVERHSLLGVVEDAALEARLPDSYEPVLAEHGRLALLDLVEDELLLAVPQVPRNPAIAEVLMSTDGEVKAGGEDEEGRRPFGDLAELIGKTGRRD